MARTYLSIAEPTDPTFFILLCQNLPTLPFGIAYSRIRTRYFVYLVRWRGQLMSALVGHCLPY